MTLSSHSRAALAQPPTSTCIYDICTAYRILLTMFSFQNIRRMAARDEGAQEVGTFLVAPRTFLIDSLANTQQVSEATREQLLDMFVIEQASYREASVQLTNAHVRRQECLFSLGRLVGLAEKDFSSTASLNWFW
ncbi:hypothetical protein J1614_001559 [Plenodomus biglobosus]|nr:hypothetical protein J1614_001559 [Plenodomus biglobosus]